MEGRIWAKPAPRKAPVNVLLITVDDMGYNTPGYIGNKTPNITPHIDRLAAEGLWIKNAHVTAAICQPSRQCLMTGRYPHNSGAPGFDPIRDDVVTLQEQLRAAGYLNGILGKVSHLAPQEKFCWDYVKDQSDLGAGRDPDLYHQHTSAFLAQARAAEKPFFLMANSHDPHRPFAGNDDRLRNRATYPPPDRIYRPDEADLPGFLPDIPAVRLEASEYYGSARRADQTIGEVLRALDESGLADDTLVMFLSDNGMAFPFAKANCYLAGTRTPWLVRWPGRVKPGSIDDQHVIGGIDYMATILEAIGIEPPPGMDGRSFLSILEGRKQTGRESTMTVINTLHSRRRYPMRAIQTRENVYIYNAWSDGETRYRNESMSGRTWRAMQAAAGDDAEIAARSKLFEFRQEDELYDIIADPSGLKDLSNEPEYGDLLAELRARLERAMAASQDPLLEGFRKHIQERLVT